MGRWLTPTTYIQLAGAGSIIIIIITVHKIVNIMSLQEAPNILKSRNIKDHFDIFGAKNLKL